MIIMAAVSGACDSTSREDVAHINALMHVTAMRCKGTCKKVVEFLH